jgi:hypothetical protein
MQRKTAVQISAVPAIAPITTPAIPPPDSEGAFWEPEVPDEIAVADEEVVCDAADVDGVDVAGGVDVDGITPNLAAIVIGSVSQQDAEFPQHQVVEFAVPSQGVISWVPPFTCRMSAPCSGGDSNDSGSLGVGVV